MNLRKKIKLSAVTLMIAAAGMACSDSSSDNGSQLQVNGNVEGDNSSAKVANVEGATVTAARVTSSGSFEAIGSSTETNASGNFELEVDASAAQHIAVMAESQGNQWKGFIASSVENGQSITLKPINTESSAESEVFAQVVASGDADIVQKSDIEAAVQSNAAATVESSSSAASSVATGLSNAAEARAEFYAEALGSESEAALNQTYEAMAQAQLRLESELAAAGSAEQEQAAYEVFFNSTTDATINAGLSEEQAATNADIWARVLVNSTTSTSSDVENSVRASASYMSAIALDKAVQARAEATAMTDQSKQTIASAGADLRASVQASAGTASEVRAAFQTYKEEVQTTMENDGSINATLVLAVDAEINGSGGFKSDFESTLSGLITANSVVDAYTDFKAEVNSSIQANGSGMSETEAQVITDLMVLINLSS